MHEERYDDEPGSAGGTGLRAVAAFAAIGTMALLMLFVVTAASTRALPAVLPGWDVSVPGVSQALAELPEGYRVEAPAEDHRFNRPIRILVLGADRRPDESPLSARTDSILVLTLDPATHRGTVLSVPRDMWVQFGEGDYGRINASFRAGAEGGGTINAGAEQTIRDLRENFGIEADYFVWLDIRGAARVIEALGGVDVDIPAELTVAEWFYSDDDETSPRYVEFPEGKQHLTGYEAIAFSRYREDSDLYRVQRQQLVLRALLEDAVAFRGLIGAPVAAWAARSVVVTDIPAGRVPGIALLASRVAGELETFSLGDQVDGTPTVWPVTTADGASVLDWDAANVAVLVANAAATR
ncbi:MAG: LCP family protein [Dehalococcoidia bacterium]|nr:LCP family protein [Dehalococcoidia bacterium]